MRFLPWPGSIGTVPEPCRPFSVLLVAILLVSSMLLFSWLVQRLTALQITSVLQLIGDKGRAVIRDMFETLERRSAPGRKAELRTGSDTQLGPISQTIVYSGEPRTIAKLEIDALVATSTTGRRDSSRWPAPWATRCSKAVLSCACMVPRERLAENDLMRAIRLGTERTFEQDPKYPIRLLVDIAIKALSPAINDPTTAIQAIDQIEDLLRRLARHDLDTGLGQGPGQGCFVSSC